MGARIQKAGAAFVALLCVVVLTISPILTSAQPLQHDESKRTAQAQLVLPGDSADLTEPPSTGSEDSTTPATSEAGAGTATGEPGSEAADEYGESGAVSAPDSPNDTDAPVAEGEEEATGKEPAGLTPLDASANISTSAQLIAELQTATEDKTLVLTDAFAADVASNPVVASFSHAFNITVDATGLSLPLKANANQILLDLTNTGAGTLTFNGLKLTTDAASSSSRALRLKGIARMSSATDPRPSNNHFAFTNCEFYGLKGGAVQAGDGNIRVHVAFTNCVFKNNYTNQSGAALFIPAWAYGTKLTLRNCSFLNNEASLGGGAIYQPDNMWNIWDVQRCFFEGNICSRGSNAVNNVGGAIGIRTTSYSTINLIDSVFKGNRNLGTGNTADGGAVAIKSNTNGASLGWRLRINGCTFEDNIANDNGGGLLIETFTDAFNLSDPADKPEIEVANCTFVGNSSGGAGGRTGGSAIQFYRVTFAKVTHCAFYDNQNGGAVEFRAGLSDPIPVANRPVFTNNILVGNTGGSSANVYMSQGSVDADTGSIAPNYRNNGNIGYDNGKLYSAEGVTGSGTHYSNGEHAASKVLTTTVFACDPAGVPLRTVYATAGAAGVGNQGQLFALTPNPQSDELYRDGSGTRYVADAGYDVLGRHRDHYSTPGPVEVYWVRFDVNAPQGGEWVNWPPDTNPSAFDSLRHPGEWFYLATVLDQQVVTIPVTDIRNSDDQRGFGGWLSNQPLTPGEVDYPTVDASVIVPATKQRYLAQWLAAKYRVDFNLQYTVPTQLVPGDPPTDVPQWGTPITGLLSGATITKPADPTRVGFVFGGWHKEAACTNAWNFATDTVTQDTILYALWKAQITVTYDAHEGLALSFSSKQVTTGDAYGEHPTTSRPGYTFEGWYTEATGGSKVEHTTLVTQSISHTLHAQWTEIAPPPPPPAKTFTVRFIDYDGTLLKSQVVEGGDNATPPARPTRSGYEFIAWNGIYINVWADQIVVAQYRAIYTPPPATPTTPTPDPPKPPEPVNPTTPVTPPAPEPQPEPDVVPVEPESIVETLEDAGIPLGGFLIEGVWSLLSLILVLIGLLGTVIQIIRLLALMVRRKFSEEDETEADSDALSAQGALSAQSEGASPALRDTAWEQERDSKREPRILLLVLPALCSLVALIVLLLLEDYSLPMAWINNHTIYLIIVFIVDVILFVASCIARVRDAKR